MDLEEKVVRFEEKTIVTLYSVKSHGYWIQGDTPVMGAERHHSHWKRDHGLYHSKPLAEKQKTAVIAQYKHEGYRGGEDGRLWGNYQDAFVEVVPIVVNKKEIGEDLDDKVVYKGEEIL